jgi:hypothetical protein
MRSSTKVSWAKKGVFDALNRRGGTTMNNGVQPSNIRYPEWFYKPGG